jgi:ATP-dependent helicase HrpB
LARERNAVLVAPPGAGKTTGAAPALLGEAWLAGQKIILLLPRRLAVRAAATRIAQMLGEAVGATVGYRVRLDSKISAATRLELMTPGVFLRQIQADPELAGVGLVVFDEVHERGLDMDLALVLSLDVQSGLREDLRLLAMSATIDADRFAAAMGGAPVVVSDGRLFPVETRYLPSRTGERLDRHVTRAVAEALASREGDILVFLPGLREIRLCMTALTASLNGRVGLELCSLHGGMGLGEQAATLKPAAPGMRKIVLSTAIAETSVTLPGVRVVIDSGLARQPRHEPDLRLSRLETVEAARSTIDQRRGRAGRVAEGLCLRLWHEGTTMARQAHGAPEILNADLSSLVLSLALWGVRDASSLPFLDTPAPKSWDGSKAWLVSIGALDSDGAITSYGQALTGFGLPPSLAHMIVQAKAFNLALTAAAVAAVLAEGASGEADLRRSVDVIATARSSRDQALRQQVSGWARLAGESGGAIDADKAGLCLALGLPDRVARRRDTAGSWQMANGRTVQIEPNDALAKHEWLVVADLQGSARNARVIAAAPVLLAELEHALPQRFAVSDMVSFDGTTKGLMARRGRSFGAIVLSATPAKVQAGPAAVAALLAGVRDTGLSVLDWSDGALNRRARLAWLADQEPDIWPDVSDLTLVDRLGVWLEPELAGKTSLSGINPGAALSNLLDWEKREALKTLAPLSWTAPSGREHAIDYAGSDLGPQIQIRAQDVFGLDRHPTILGGRHRLLLALTSPALRPIALTSDLPGFWRGGWADVRKDMRARYPKHDWPEQPWLAKPPPPRDSTRRS